MDTLERLPKDHAGQLFYVLDGDPIEDLKPYSIQYQDNESRRLYNVLPIALEAMGTMRMSRPDEVTEAFVASSLPNVVPFGERIDLARQIMNGDVAHVFCVNSPGGSGHFAKNIMYANREAEARGCSVVGFFQSQIASAAFNVAMSVPHRYTTARAQFLWHYAHFLNHDQSVYAEAHTRALESDDNKRREQEFLDFLRFNVRSDKRDDAVKSFKMMTRQTHDRQFKFQGTRMADWGLAELLSEERKPSVCFKDLTGIDVTVFEPDNRVRRFIEWFDAEVERESMIRPIL